MYVEKYYASENHFQYLTSWKREHTNKLNEFLHNMEIF